MLIESITKNMRIQKILYYFAFLCSFILSTSCSTNKSYVKIDSPKNNNRVLYDNDGSDLLMNNWWNNRPLTIADLDSCVDMVAHSQVTTYMMCTGSEFAYYRSKYCRTFGDDDNGTKGFDSNPASYKLFHQAYLNHLMLEQHGTDLIRETLCRAKQHKMETFLTFRVNDLHFNDTTMHAPMFYSDWWLQHPQFWVNDTTQGWHSAGALDFAHKEVRERKLAVISEQLEKYGDIIDGYVLDFMRFFVYFKPGEGPQHKEEMTQFLRNIRKKVELEATRRHRKIILGVRVAPTLKDNMRNGLDIRKWLKEGLVDFVALGIHIRIDPAMPVAQFRKDLGKTLNVPLYASNDVVCYQKWDKVSQGMIRGFCSHSLSQGADGIYLFNYYFGESNQYHHQYHLEKGGQVCRYAMPQMLQELGKLSTLEGRNKIYALSDGKIEYGVKPNTPLPLTLQPKEMKLAPIYIGDEMKPQKPQEVILFYRTNRPAEVEVTVNGKPSLKEVPSYVALYDRENHMEGTDKVYAVTLPMSALCHGYNNIHFISKENQSTFQIKRVELFMKYGDVTTHGYF